MDPEPIACAAAMVASEDEVRGCCRDRISHDPFAHDRIPKFIRYVEAVPMIVTGKIQKYLIRVAMVGELNAAA